MRSKTTRLMQAMTKQKKYELNKMPLRQRAKLMAESKKEKFEKSLKKAKAKKDPKPKAGG